MMELLAYLALQHLDGKCVKVYADDTCQCNLCLVYKKGEDNTTLQVNVPTEQQKEKVIE